MKYAEKLNIVHKSGAEGTQLRNLYFIFNFMIMERRNMTADYSFLRDAIKHPNNKKKHVPALKRLITLFENKWEGSYDPKTISFLKMRIKHI
jgi:hypothetical protein